MHEIQSRVTGKHNHAHLRHCWPARDLPAVHGAPRAGLVVRVVKPGPPVSVNCPTRVRPSSRHCTLSRCGPLKIFLVAATARSTKTASNLRAPTSRMQQSHRALLQRRDSLILNPREPVLINVERAVGIVGAHGRAVGIRNPCAVAVEQVVVARGAVNAVRCVERW